MTATPNGQLYDVALVSGTTAQLTRDTATSVWPLAQVSAARPADIVPGSTPGTDRLNTDSMRTMLMESARKVGPVLDILKE